MNNKLRYVNYDIVFQEVPNEISLAISISGCPHKCEGCHSKFLWDNQGEILESDICSLIQKYQDMITCVCLMGGDQNLENLTSIIKIIKDTFDLKVCLYSGLNDISDLKPVIYDIDYLKLGSYDKDKGALDCPSTNQRFYFVNGENLTDKTYLFYQKKGYLK